ncbi:hippurate hydrolase [Diplodia corticola]|uniref:Hippurate hydrolase n=1 Tax=Diplodia corticola TaxID=236234 RepID=A0A1J9R027_9PEZI|nr:hippurate hydrolase [Diplodia corticola]OJD33984.1 hippurate hydrolase [Diplodia corticola]
MPPPSRISQIITAHRPALAPYEELYKHLHQTPELSFQERDTAAEMRKQLASIFARHPHLATSIHPDIGGTHGLAATIRNPPSSSSTSSSSDSPPPSPIVLLRADMDGLPVKEATGLPYASTKTMEALGGDVKPVMHACGHDMHMASLLAAVELLCVAKDEWQGTVVVCFQPAEELGKGALAMVEGGLYDVVPVPDVVVGGHVLFQKAGTIGTRRGLVASAADSYNLTIHGRGGHASQPHLTIDPIVTAAHTITRLQTIASREVDPQEAAVVSVGYVRAGDAVNIIPASASLGVDVRTFSPGSRARVLAAVRRIVDAESAAAGGGDGTVSAPELVETRTFPFLVNDEGATARVEEAFEGVFGEGYDREAPRLGGSEDCGVLATSVGRPGVFFTWGGTDPELWDRLEREGGEDGVRMGVPINHSPFFAPVIGALRFGVDGYAGGALAFLVKE